MAGNGSRGLVQGVDYRGVAVLADIRAVPGTPWLAVTKVDMDEAMAPWRAGSIQITCLLAGLVATVAALFFALWQFRAKAQHQLLLEAGVGAIGHRGQAGGDRGRFPGRDCGHHDGWRGYRLEPREPRACWVTPPPKWWASPSTSR